VGQAEANANRLLSNQLRAQIAPELKMEPYRIVHISDLHFGAPFDAALWTYVRSVVIEKRPQLIVLSGDVVNSPNALRMLLARKELRKLERESGAKLFVIPGNHDIAAVGNFRMPFSSKLFWRIFAGDTQALEANLPDPPWKDDRTALPQKRRLARTRRFFSISIQRMRAWWWARRLPDPSREKREQITSNSHVLVMGFDSNSRTRLATGYVDQREIYDAATYLDSSRSTGRNLAQALALRIAVVHHHPAPIPFAIAQEGLLGFEPFLMFRNAGTFLKMLNERSFDLVLHGHYHYYNFSRIAFGAESSTYELGILSAGSATVRYSEGLRNSFNVITILPNGRVEITPYFMGGGATLGSSTAPSFGLHTIAGLKFRNYRRALSLHEIDRDEVAYKMEVDPFGTAWFDYSLSGLKVYGDYRTDGRSFEIEVLSGRAVPKSFTLNEESRRRGFSDKPLGPEGENKIGRRIAFGRELVSSAREGIDYGFSWRTQNSIRLTNWESEEVRKIRAREKPPVPFEPTQGLVFTVTFPVRKLTLTVKLPAELEEMRPFLQCDIPKGYPDIPLNADREVETPPEKEVDAEMSESEAPNLKREATGEWIAQIDFPLVGYTYGLRWNVAALKREPPSLAVVGGVKMFREMLLRYRERRSAGQPNPKVSEILEGLLANIRNEFGSPDQQELLSVSLMTYDESVSSLVIVDMVSTARREIRWNFKLALGDGLGGAAFKQRRPLLYAVDAIHATLGGDAYLPPAAEERTDDYQVLASFPVFHPLSRRKMLGPRPPSPEETAGVISIGSTSSGSQLLKLAEPSSQQGDAAKFQDLWGFAQLVFQRIMDALLSQ